MMRQKEVRDVEVKFVLNNSDKGWRLEAEDVLWKGLDFQAEGTFII